MEERKNKESIDDTFNKVSLLPCTGEIATYIPKLEQVDPTKFGVHYRSLTGEAFGFGDYQEKFSIQSIAKVFSLTLAYKIEKASLWKRVGVEPSGTSYNSLILLELEKGIPRNPLINAGAIVIADVLISALESPEEYFLDFVKKISKNDKLKYAEDIFVSEKAVAYKNYALVHLMKSQGNITNDIDTVMNFYFRICSIEMTCEELTQCFAVFSNCGIDITTGEEIIEENMCKRINAIMLLCGFYDEAGEFAFRVGLPGKSGVGGGIVAIKPSKYSICTWSPKLNKKGNSARGVLFLEELTSVLNDSIF